MMRLLCLLLFAGWFARDALPPAPIGPFYGYAAHYSEGLMEHVSQGPYRRMPLVSCMVATDLVPLGFWVDVQSQLTGEVKRCRATDLSATVDRPRHLQTRLYIEFDWPSARSMCKLQFVAERGWRACPVVVWLRTYPKGFTPPVLPDRVDQPPRAWAKYPLFNPWQATPGASGGPETRVTGNSAIHDPVCHSILDAPFEPQCAARQDGSQSTEGDRRV